MTTSRKILANLGYRVYCARHKINFRKHYIDTQYEFLYHEAVAEWAGLHNAYQQAKHIYFENMEESE